MNDIDHVRVVRIFVGPSYIVRAVLAAKVKENAQAMAADGETKMLQHQGEFQHQNCMLGSLHDSDHDGVGKFFAGHS